MDEAKLAHFPTLTLKYRMNTAKGPSEYVTCIYFFRFAPASWRQLQQIGRMKVLMKRLIPSIEFDENMDKPDPNNDAEIGHTYSVTSLGKYFKDFVKFPNPYYPQEKNELLSRLAKYAKRLHYEGMFHFELVMAMAIHFNEKIGTPYNRKQIQSKTLSVMSLDRTKWNIKLDKPSLKKAHIRGGVKRGAKISAEAKKRQLEVQKHIPNCTKENGKTDINKLMEFTGLSRSSIYTHIKKLKG